MNKLDSATEDNSVGTCGVSRCLMSGITVTTSVGKQNEEHAALVMDVSVLCRNLQLVRPLAGGALLETASASGISRSLGCGRSPHHDSDI